MYNSSFNSNEAGTMTQLSSQTTANLATQGGVMHAFWTITAAAITLDIIVKGSDNIAGNSSAGVLNTPWQFIGMITILIKLEGKQSRNNKASTSGVVAIHNDFLLVSECKFSHISADQVVLAILTEKKHSGC